MNKPPLPIHWRRLSQVLCFTAFLVLFVRTDYQGQDQLSGVVNLLFRIDPLVALAASLASRTIITLLLPAFLVLLAALLLGRWFCGWVCPMGALLDLARPLSAKGGPALPGALPRLRYLLLLLILVGAFFGLPLVGFFDPFALLVRGLTMAIYPALAMAVESLFTFTYQQGPDWLNLLSEPLYRLLRSTVLPFEQKLFALALPAALMLLTPFVLERLQRRFFCRNLCPLGALLGLAARFAPWRIANRRPLCRACGQCGSLCRTGAIDQTSQVNSERCVLCLECLASCPNGHFTFGRHSSQPIPLADGLSRRAFVGTALAGIATPLLLAVRPFKQQPAPGLIRPPGALAEELFLGRCVRCGECMQVCINNALHPAFTEAGVEGLFTPRLIPRIGYCEYRCTLCGQVCPTGAIRRLPLAQKQATFIGRAYLDRNRCLPYAKQEPCMVCEELCPTAPKAIRFREVVGRDDQGQAMRIKQPYVVDELCIGCGLCENKCPLPGRSAIRVTSAGESRREKANRESYG